MIRQLLSRHQFQFSKSLGQNFLINPTVCPRIAHHGVTTPDTGVIEIGPGIGVLTNELCKHAAKVVSIELDQRLLPILSETLAEHHNVTILHADVMKLDLHALIVQQFSGMPVCVCANLPYYITSPVLMMLLEQRLPLDSITVMVQKEAARRLSAPLGDRACGAVTFAVRYYSQPKCLFPVPRGSFLPPPNVDSAVIQFDITTPPSTVTDEAFLFKLVRGAFSQRRKTLANPVSKALGIPKEDVLSALEQIAKKTTIRPEEMLFEDWINLSNYLWSK